MPNNRALMGTVSLIALSAAGLFIARSRRGSRHQNSDHGETVADLRRLRLQGRRRLRKDRRQSVRRARSEGPQERRHRRHPACAEERQGQRRVRLRFLHLEADRFEQGRSQGHVRAAQSRRQDARPAQSRRGRRRPGIGDRSESSRQHLPAPARLHDDLERVGLLGRVEQRGLQHDDHAPGCQESGRLHDHRTGLRIHRGARRSRTI